MRKILTMFFVIFVTSTNAQNERKILSFNAQNTKSGDVTLSTTLDAIGLYHNGKINWEKFTNSQISENQRPAFAKAAQNCFQRAINRQIVKLDEKYRVFGVIKSDGRKATLGSSEVQNAVKKYFANLKPCKVDFGNSPVMAYGVPYDQTNKVWLDSAELVRHAILGEKDCLCEEINGNFHPAILAECLNPLPEVIYINPINIGNNLATAPKSTAPTTATSAPEVKLSPELQKSVDEAVKNGGFVNIFAPNFAPIVNGGAGGEGGSVTNSGNSGGGGGSTRTVREVEVDNEEQVMDWSQVKRKVIDQSIQTNHHTTTSNCGCGRSLNSCNGGCSNNVGGDYATLAEQKKQTNVMRWGVAGAWISPILAAGLNYGLSRIPVRGQTGNTGGGGGTWGTGGGSGTDGGGIQSTNAGGFGTDGNGVQ